MSTLNIIKAIKKMSVNHLRDFIFENYYKQIGFSEEDSYYLMKHLKRKDLLVLANKLIRKMPDPCNTKEHCESFLRKKNKASVRQSAIITYQSKMFDTVDIESVITEYTKISRRLSEGIRQAEKVSCNSALLLTQKHENFLNKKMTK